MKAIVIEVHGGCIISINKILQSPKKGIIILDHDNIGQADDRLSEAERSLENFYELDGSIDYNLLKTQTLEKYKSE